MPNRNVKIKRGFFIKSKYFKVLIYKKEFRNWHPN